MPRDPNEPTLKGIHTTQNQRQGYNICVRNVLWGYPTRPGLYLILAILY